MVDAIASRCAPFGDFSATLGLNFAAWQLALLRFSKADMAAPGFELGQVTLLADTVAPGDAPLHPIGVLFKRPDRVRRRGHRCPPPKDRRGTSTDRFRVGPPSSVRRLRSAWMLIDWKQSEIQLFHSKILYDPVRDMVPKIRNRRRETVFEILMRQSKPDSCAGD
jgi:hypothetical protein